MTPEIHIEKINGSKRGRRWYLWFEITGKRFECIYEVQHGYNPNFEEVKQQMIKDAEI